MFKYYRYVWPYRVKVWPWQLRRRSVAEGLINGRRLLADRSAWPSTSVSSLRKATRPGPELVATAKLRPGASVIIETIDPRTERGG